MALFKNTPTPQARVVFDIGDDSIAVAVISIQKNRPEIIWSHRRPIPVSRHDYKDHSIRSLRQGLEAVSKKLQTTGLPTARRFGFQPEIEAVFCIFSPEWQQDDTVSSRIEKDHSFVASRQHVYQAQKEAHKKFAKQVTASSKDLEHLSQRTISLSGDGSRLSLSQQRPIKKLDLYIYISKVPQSTKKSVERILAQSFHKDKLSFHSGTDTTHRVLTQAFSHPEDFFVITPGRKQTNTLLIKDGRLAKLSRGPMGKDFLHRTISDALRRSCSEIRSRLGLHQRRKHHEIPAREMQIALEETGKRWGSSVGRNLHELSAGMPPKHAYLLLPTNEQEVVFHHFFEGMMATLPHLRVHVVDDHLLSDHFRNPGPVDHRLALGILGTHKY